MAIDSVEVHQATNEHANYAEGKPVSFLLVPRPDRLRFTFGHHVHEQMLRVIGTPAVTFTGLREPVERIRSEIRYLHMQEASRGENLTPPDVAAEWSRNDVCRQIIDSFPLLAGNLGSMADRAMRVLEALSFVYFEDTIEEAFAAIHSALGIPPDRHNANISPKSPIDFDVSPSTPGEDVELYERARERFWRSDFSSCMYPTDRIVEFAAGEPDLATLRHFINKAIGHEMSGWRVTAEFLTMQSRLAAEQAALVEAMLRMPSNRRQIP